MSIKWHMHTNIHMYANHAINLLMWYTFADQSLVLNLTVDDNTRRLEKLEEALARMKLLGKYISTSYIIEMRSFQQCVPSLYMLRKQSVLGNWKSLFLDWSQCYSHTVIHRYLTFHNKVHHLSLPRDSPLHPELHNHHFLLHNHSFLLLYHNTFILLSHPGTLHFLSGDYPSHTGKALQLSRASLHNHPTMLPPLYMQSLSHPGISQLLHSHQNILHHSAQLADYHQVPLTKPLSHLWVPLSRPTWIFLGRRQRLPPWQLFLLERPFFLERKWCHNVLLKDMVTTWTSSCWTHGAQGRNLQALPKLLEQYPCFWREVEQVCRKYVKLAREYGAREQKGNYNNDNWTRRKVWCVECKAW